MTKQLSSRIEAIVIASMVGFWLFASANAKANDKEAERTKSAGAKAMHTNVQTPSATAESRLTAANTRFGFKLFSALFTQDRGKNIFVSPSSVAFALAMTYNGAGGETQQAMAKALELQGLSLPEVNQASAALRTTLASLDPKVQLAIANSLWAKRGIALKPDFVKRNQEFYQAEVQALDFSDPGAPQTINAWVSKHTNGKINKIIERINAEAILFLINAIYFKGNWEVAFEKKLTKEGTFNLSGGRKKKLPVMSQSSRYPYYRGNKFQAVSLSYGTGRVSMYIFLPDQNSSLDAFLANLNAENWESWMSQFGNMKGDIVLPRFKLEYEAVLNDALKALGMEMAFNRQRANFSGISAISPEANIFIDQVRHKTFLEVNEEGTEAAAATSVGIGITAIQESFRLVIDRPFFCAIRDNKTGAILFMGAIVEPM
jgi:serpin B